ncbi:MAG: XRE family transcriptional regulator [Burkholderiales bacterium 68-12]|nr:MAG: XRE family transcriptional regulator [Burkholderiales bacterium 68-12]
MDLTGESFPTLAERLMAERKRQKLSREQAAAVCNVSTSFIRDAESDPARCSLGKLLLLMRGLGLSLQVQGWSDEPTPTQAVAVSEGPGPA